MASTKVYKVTGFDKVIFNGVELNQVPPTLEECRWDEIQELVKTGRLGDYFSLDSRKDIKLSSGETITMRLVSINDGTGEYGAYYPAGTADFVALNSTSNNNNSCRWYRTDTGASTTGWWDSEVRQYIQNIYSKLPTELQSMIVEKEHIYTRSWWEDLGSEYRIKTEIRFCSDKIWLPTAAEMDGGSFQFEKAEHNKRYIPLESNRGIYFYKRITSSEKAFMYYDNNRTKFSGSNVLINNDGSFSDYSFNDASLLPVIIGFRIG